MADPLSVGASVVGLTAAAAHVSSILLDFVGNVKDAPILARHVMSEINAIRTIISSLQTYLWGDARTTGSQESMILVEHVAIILTACVFTFAELETEVSALKSNYNMKALERVKWARKKGTIAQIFARLQNHKTSLGLMLDILQSQTNAQAERSLDNLCVSVNEILASQRGISERLERLETGMNPAGSLLTARENNIDATSLYSLESTTSRRTAETIVSRFKFSFDNTLNVSRVYKRANFRYPMFPGGSRTSSIAAQSMGWSFMSGLSISDISKVSVLSLPIYPPDIPNNQFYTFEYKTLHSAASSGDINAIQILLKRSGSTDIFYQRDARGRIPLHIAAEHGHKDFIQLLVDNGSDISVVETKGWTALHFAASNGHKDTVELLLENGADISAAEAKRWTALHFAASNGHKDTVELLLEKGADISAVEAKKWTALHFAASNGHNNTVELLLENRADISAVEAKKWTALHFAASSGHKDTVQLLLENGADISAAEAKGWTALHFAAQNGNKDTVELLLDKGADISAVEGEEETALHIAAYNGHKDTVELLLENGADISTAAIKGWTALHIATYRGHKDTVQCLLEKGADISAVEAKKWTALHFAASNGYKDMVQILLGNGADISAMEEEGQTALHMAAYIGYKDMVELLLKSGADISAVTLKGWTSLHIAAKNGNIDMVQLLLGNGADILATNNAGLTASKIAFKFGYMDIAGIISPEFEEEVLSIQDSQEVLSTESLEIPPESILD